jgi:competence ComEA-like helix-hairpin-helix protein
VRARRIGICGLIALAALPATAKGQAAGQFGITPARRNLIARPPVVLQPTQVFNRTGTTFVVRVLPVLLHQRVDGSFDFRLGARELHAAALILSARPQRFTMAPNTRRDISLTWSLLPRRTRAAYVGLLVQGVPRGAQRSRIRNQLRLLGINFFRLPGRYFSRGHFTGLRGEQFGRRIRFFARVRNEGQVVSSPRHTLLAVLDSAGRTVYRTRWPGDVILPGAQRDFPIVVHTRLPAGRYRGVVRMRLGRSQDQASLGFRLVAPNRLPTPKVVLRALNAQGEVQGSAHATADVSSIGNAPASPSVTLELFAVARGVAGRRPIASKHVSFKGLEPGKHARLDVDFGGSLKKAPYRVVATYRPARGTDPVQLISDFVPTPHRSFLDRIGDWLDQNLALIIALVAALAIGALAYLFVRSRRRYERELAAARGGTPVAPPESPRPRVRAVPAPKGVDINTAGVDELVELPGVGSAIAARLVEDREANGPFASVEDLRRVKGFGEVRVERLASHATVGEAAPPREDPAQRRRDREEAKRRERHVAEAREREEAAAARERERQAAEAREREEAKRRERDEAERREREKTERREQEAAEAQRREHEAAKAREREAAQRREREEAERREREAAEQAAPAAPPPEPSGDRPPPWADPTAVNLNTADIAELTRLPGIGRGAARRIVEYREANGPLRSVGDLERVEGFDASRVARVARRATV